MICFWYFCQKKVFLILGVAHNNPFSLQIGSKKKQFLKGFTSFFRNSWIAKQVIDINHVP